MKNSLLSFNITLGFTIATMDEGLPSAGGTRAEKYTINVNEGIILGGKHIGDIVSDIHHGNLHNITIDSKYLSNMQKKFAESLVDFCNRINDEFQKENLPATSIMPLQLAVNELAQSTSGSEDFSQSKKTLVRGRLVSLAIMLVKVSPIISKRLIGFSPLAPFGSLVEEQFEKMIQSAIES